LGRTGRVTSPPHPPNNHRVNHMIKRMHHNLHIQAPLHSLSRWIKPSLLVSTLLHFSRSCPSFLAYRIQQSPQPPRTPHNQHCLFHHRSSSPPPPPQATLFLLLRTPHQCRQVNNVKVPQITVLGSRIRAPELHPSITLKVELVVKGTLTTASLEQLIFPLGELLTRLTMRSTPQIPQQ
jgi:hypothetical protein